MIFVRQRRTNDGRYNCQYKQYGRCSNPVCISESKIAPVVWNAVQTQLAMFADFEAVTERLKSNATLTNRQVELQQEITLLGEKLGQYQKKREQLYDDYADGILSAEDYSELKSRFDASYQEQSSRLNQVSVELMRLNRMLSAENKWLVNVRNIRKSRKLTPEMAEALIDHIDVHKTAYAQYRIEIVFRFQEEYSILEAAYRELAENEGEAR